MTIITGISIAEQYEKNCKTYGVRLIAIPSHYENPIKYYSELWRNLKAENYDIIHNHRNSSMMAIELTIAKLASIKIRIAHNHNSRCQNKKIDKLLNVC